MSDDMTMKKSPFLRLGAYAFSTLLAVALTGCRTGNPGATPSYTGLMSSRGSIPPAYAQVQPLPASASQARPALPDAPASAGEGVYGGIGEENAFVAPAPELVNQVEVVEVEAPLPPQEAPAPQETEEPKGWTLPPVPKAQPAPAGEAAATYVVRGGDSLSRIAAAHGVKTADLLAANPKITSPDKIQVGQVLNLPAGAKANAAPATTKATTKDSQPASGKGVAREAIPEDGKYTVRSGDSLWLIARRFGVKSADLTLWNNLSSDRLQVGQVLTLKGTPAPAAPAPAPAVVPAAAPVPAPAVEEPLLPPVEPAPAPAETEEKVAQWDYFNHTAAENETLQSIADMYETTVEDLLQLNPQIKSDSDLKPQVTVLKVPSRSN